MPASKQVKGKNKSDTQIQHHSELTNTKTKGQDTSTCIQAHSFEH